MSNLSRRHVLVLGLGLGVQLVAGPEFALAATAERAINAIREAHQRAHLRFSSQLQDAAENQARLMAKYDRISHDLGPGFSFRNRVRDAGIRGSVGENLSAGRSEINGVLDGWMHSSGHRANLLRRDFRSYGLASAWVRSGVQSRYGIYWAMVFSS